VTTRDHPRVCETRLAMCSVIARGAFPWRVIHSPVPGNRQVATARGGAEGGGRRRRRRRRRRSADSCVHRTRVGRTRDDVSRPCEEKAIAGWRTSSRGFDVARSRYIVLSATASDIISGTAPSSSLASIDLVLERPIASVILSLARARTHTRASRSIASERASERALAVLSMPCGEGALRGGGRQARNTFTESPEIITAKQSRLVGKFNWLRVPAHTSSLLASIGGSRLGRPRIRCPRDDPAVNSSPLPAARVPVRRCLQTNSTRRAESTHRAVLRPAPSRDATFRDAGRRGATRGVATYLSPIFNPPAERRNQNSPVSFLASPWTAQLTGGE